MRDLTKDSASSALLVVAAGGLSTLPVLVFGPWGGVLGDRIDRKKVVIAIQAFMVLTSLIIGWFVDLTTVVIAIMTVGGLSLALGAVSIFTLPRVRQLS